MKARHIVGLTVLSAGLMLATQNTAGQDAKPTQPEIRERIVEQLERTRAREGMLKRQLERLDNGEEIGSEEFGRDHPERPDRFENDQPREIQEGQLLLVIKDLDEQHEEYEGPRPFQRILESDSVERQRLLRRLAPRLRKLVELRERNPERYKVHLEEMSAGMRIARSARNLGMVLGNDESDETAIRTARDELRAAISAAFDAKAAVAREELLEVQAKLDALTEEIAAAETDRQERIDTQFEAIVQKIRAGGWMRGFEERRHREDARPKRSGDD